jgi:hypothetical protein
MRHREAGEGMGKWGTIAIPGFKGGVPRRESMPEKRPPLMGDRGEEGKGRKVSSHSYQMHSLSNFVSHLKTHPCFTNSCTERGGPVGARVIQKRAPILGLQVSFSLPSQASSPSPPLLPLGNLSSAPYLTGEQN